MSHSIYLLVAACFTGAGVDESVIEVPAQAVQATMTAASPEPLRAEPAPRVVSENVWSAAPTVKAPTRAAQKPAVISSAPVQEEKPGLLHRLGSLFHQRQTQHAQGCCGSPACGACAQSRLTASAEPPLAESQVVHVGHVESDIRKQYVDRIGHEEDYSWVTGELFYVRSARGQWVVRYATVDTEDRYGGSVVLAAAVNMKNFREGDLVTVRGGILNDGRASRYLGGPLYRAEDISMIERSDP